MDRFPARSRAVVACLVTAVLLTACSGPQSALDPAGPSARRLSTLWWGLFAVAAVVFAVVLFMIVWALVLRRGPSVQPRRGGERTVVIAGILVPAVVLVATYAATLSTLSAERTPPQESELTIEAVGHDWWWEVRYPDFVTANEIHIPVGRPVTVRLTTADVIHSFWVPSITSKTDMIPGRVNELSLLADRAGTFRGQCAEYCGTQHAGMSFLVVAEPEQDFARWLADQSRPADSSAPDALAALGEEVFEASSCAACHTVRGTTADGDLGPDLTHFGGRRELGAGVAPNNPGWLAGWIANSQTVKPGNLMPPQPLAPEDLRVLVRYLESLE